MATGHVRTPTSNKRVENVKIIPLLTQTLKTYQRPSDPIHNPDDSNPTDELYRLRSITLRDWKTPENLECKQKFPGPENEEHLNFSAKLQIDSAKTSRFKQDGITVVGGHGFGNQLNQLSYPQGIFVDQNKTIYIADCENDRIVEWKCESNTGQITIGGNGKGERTDQMNSPIDMIVDKQNNYFIVSDRWNRRIVRWSGQNQQILLSNIDCVGLAGDKHGYIYACDCVKNKVRQWKEGDPNGKLVVARGNGQGHRLNQLDNPSFIFVDDDNSLYVTDTNNHRVMKWKKDSKEGIVVAGGHGLGSSQKQLSYPQGVTVDRWGQVDVSDKDNHRVMCWSEGYKEGSIEVGGNEIEGKTNQLNYPQTLAFDLDGNLYVADFWNHRVQKFELNRK